MTKKQLAILFLCSSVSASIGNGVLPLLPVYATQLGATPLIAGFYLSFCYLAIATGAILAGWLSDRLQRRKITLIVVDIAAIVPIYLMGQARNIWALTFLNAFVWLMGGVKLALVNIFAGMFAAQSERGKVFGVLSITTSLGLLIGGLVAGPIVDKWGYAALFSVSALFAILSPLAALYLEDKPVVRDRPQAGTGYRTRAKLGRPFTLLFAANLFAAVGGFARLFGRSLAMDGLGFAATAISSTGMIGGLVSLPLPPGVGWLSDRMERRPLLALGYLLGLSSPIVLLFSSALWHFWIAVILHYVSLAIVNAVGPALVADVVPAEALGRAMSRFSATLWIGGIIGFAGTGYAIQRLGLDLTFVLGACLSLVAMVLIAALHQAAPKSTQE